MKKFDFVQAVQLLANLGVIAGIVFLAFELRQNTQAVQSAAGIGLQDQVQSIYEMLDAPMLEIMLKGAERPESLTPVEAAELNIFYTIMFQAYQNLYFQVQSGAFDAARADGWWQELRNVFEYGPARGAWRRRGYILAPEFRAFVDAQVRPRAPTPESSMYQIALD